METMQVAGIELDIDVLGEGPPMLYLHPEHYEHLHEPFVAKLAERWKVYYPRHPGFDGRRPPFEFRSVDDLAYLYLDLLDQLDLLDVTLLGTSFGGWIGIEMAVRNAARLKSLSLISPLGAKLSGRDEVDFVDLSALPDDEAANALFSEATLDLGTFSEAQLIGVARDRQFLAYYAWKPYLHNPILGRWLHRIKVPVRLIWGETDGYITTAYGKRLAERIQNAKIDIVLGAGHYPQVEKLDETISALVAGLGG